MNILRGKGSMRKNLTMLISGVGIFTLISGLAGCDVIPVYDPNKVNWPDRMPWQQKAPTSTSSSGGTIPEAKTAPPVYGGGSSSSNNQYDQRGRGVRGDYASYPAVRRFIADMSRKHKFSTAFLEQTLSPVRRNSEVLKKAGAPAEGKAWRAYRPIFLTEDRIRGGVDFWNRHRSALDAASRKYGVPPEYITAIIGVETAYGRNMGKYNVLQSLTTLAFDFPKRSDFYRRELEQFLLLTREQRIQPNSLKGSYAGAMGMSQFISSSYRHYAVDFNNDKKTDLWRPDDAIGSVANYFSKHGWKRGGDVAIPARVSGSSYHNMADTTAKKPRYSMSQLDRAGVRPTGRFWAKKASLIKLVGTRETEYWIGGENFYVITRYNHSPKYAMAVHQLAQEIRRRH